MAGELEELRRKRDAAAGRTKYVVAGVISLMVLAAVATYFWEQHTHGPFSADEYVGRSLSEARSVAPDAALTSLSATYVNQEGGIQAAFDSGRYWRNAGYLVMSFRSSSQPAAKPRQAVPLGAPAPDEASPVPSGCRTLRVSTGLHGSGKQTHFGLESSWRSDGRCEDPLPSPVHCRIAEIWRRAIAAGAPHPAFATITLNGAGWHFYITNHDDHDKVVFRGDYADDCR